MVTGPHQLAGLQVCVKHEEFMPYCKSLRPKLTRTSKIAKNSFDFGNFLRNFFTILVLAKCLILYEFAEIRKKIKFLKEYPKDLTLFILLICFFLCTCCVYFRSGVTRKILMQIRRPDNDRQTRTLQVTLTDFPHHRFLRLAKNIDTIVISRDFGHDFGGNF